MYIYIYIYIYVVFHNSRPMYDTYTWNSITFYSNAVKSTVSVISVIIWVNMISKTINSELLPN